jgi:hypothetical protein
VAGKIRSIEKSSDLIGNRTRNLPACSIAPQPTTGNDYESLMRCDVSLRLSVIRRVELLKVLQRFDQHFSFHPQG